MIKYVVFVRGTNGETVYPQEGVLYDSEKSAAEVIKLLYPSNSVWEGAECEDGWKILTSKRGDPIQRCVVSVEEVML